MTGLRRPFIYIASLPRTGSTLLSEILTQLPHSFIFHEPHLGKNYFAFQHNDQAKLKPYDVDLARFRKLRLPLAFFFRRLRIIGYRQDYMVQEFKHKLIPQLSENLFQIGVKEIKHAGWQNYVRHFPEMKVVLTGRDPRDIYISMFEKWRRGSMLWKGSFSPNEVAARLRAEFQRQLSLRTATDTMLVKYEDLCTDPELPQKVRDFVNSPIPHIGEVGSFVATHPRRVNEYDVHGKQITDKRVNRWRKEPDEKLLEDAHAFFSLMDHYCEFWQYDA